MKLRILALALGIFGLATPAMAVRFELVAIGQLAANQANNPVLGLPFGTNDQVFARWTIDIDAATSLDLTPPLDPATGQSRVWLGAVSGGEIVISSGFGTTYLTQNANSAGSIGMLNDARSGGNVNTRLDQVLLSDGVSYGTNGVTQRYDLSGPAASDLFLSSVAFGRVQSTTFPLLPGLITSVDRPDLFTLFANSVELFSLTFRQGTATTPQLAAALPTSGFTVINRSIFLIPFEDAVPEPQSWAMLIAGFGIVGAAMRRRRAQAA